ncbi:MAG: hypothetical protein Q7S33_00425 [Nanoarchaeota archaeon]|nr:hypothetical protein [Nanoarchaeota archaeon]
MGGPCCQLIPVAILYDYSGITKEELAYRLDKSIEKLNPISLPFTSYPKGLYGAAVVLNLKNTERYNNLLKLNWDDDLCYYKLREHLFFNNFNDGPNLTIERKSHKILEEGIVLDTMENVSSLNIFEGYKKGDYIDYIRNMPLEKKFRGAEFQVTEVLKTEIEEEAFDSLFVNQKLIARVIEFDTQIEKFNSSEELIKKYPEYAPEEISDFQQEQGILFPSNKRDSDVQFRWIKKEDKYYLDRNYMANHLSPNSIFADDARSHGNGCAGKEGIWYHKTSRNGTFSLTDLILTAEAIRREEYSVLQYVGFRHNFLKFINSNQKTLERYERAVIDTELSFFAENNRLTNSEFLREHMIMMKNLQRKR